MTMNAAATSIVNLFNSSTVYVIPTFQRPYAWEETQWDEMIEDTRTAAGKKKIDTTILLPCISFQ